MCDMLDVFTAIYAEQWLLLFFSTFLIRTKRSTKFDTTNVEWRIWEFLSTAPIIIYEFCTLHITINIFDVNVSIYDGLVAVDS
jgi:hypothetical protein